MTASRAAAAPLWIALLSVPAACTPSDPTAGRHATDSSAATEARAVAPDTTRLALPQPGALTSVPSAPVSHWQGPGGQSFEVALRTVDPVSALSRRFGTITLRTSLRMRAPDLGQYPCTSCHLGRRMVLADTRVADAHENINAVHPAQTGGACSTCHAPDNVELLALKSGERATLDHTYRVCAQCHFSQAEAWAGGAHGKRLDGWQGRRVLMGCADCHDPHSPAIEQRIPFRGPQLQRVRGRNP